MEPYRPMLAVWFIMGMPREPARTSPLMGYGMIQARIAELAILARGSCSMLDDRSPFRRNFFNAPQSVTSVVAAVWEPLLTVLMLGLIHVWRGDVIDRPEWVLGFLVVALTFPGRNRFHKTLLTAGTEIAASWLVVVLILWLCAYLTQSLHLFNLKALAVWIVVTPCLHWASIGVGQKILRQYAAHPEHRRTAVVIGAGRLGARVAKALTHPDQLGVDLMGFFDDRTKDRLNGNATHQRLGGLEDAAPYISQFGIHEVYMTLPLSMQPRIMDFLEQIQATTVSIYFVPDTFSISIIQGRLEDLHGIPVVGICETPFTGINAMIKRLSDIALSLLVLILGLPLLMAVAIGVKLSSPGPAIFRQKRNGLNGDEIVVYKFRSMTTQDNGPRVRQATRDDERITRFGAFIRRTSLDELPQFINVLQGSMSVVGPRPHAVAHNNQYRQLIKAYMVRHKVKPGITGWAQVNGHRGETDTLEKMRARVEHDLDYLRNWSLVLDLQIIIRTIRLIFFDRNAY